MTKIFGHVRQHDRKDMRTLACTKLNESGPQLLQQQTRNYSPALSQVNDVSHHG